MERIGKFIKPPTPPTAAPQKRGGANTYSNHLRAETADLLKVPYGQVAGLTRGFSPLQLERMLKAAKEWVNPPALWWKLYKKEKLYAKQTKQVRRVRGVGQDGGRKGKTDKAQGVLF